MRKLALSLIVAFAVYVTAAAAQAGAGAGPGSQGTQGSSPSMQQPGQQPGTAQPGTAGQPPDMGPSTSDQNGNTANTNSTKGEKKLKGCVESQGGQYVLETKKGPVSLTGQDVSAHVGHEVTVKGMWENGSNSSATATSSGAESTSKGTFNVTNVKMDSETCKIKTKDNMGTSGNSGMGGSNSTGSSTGTGASSSGSPSGTGTGSSTGTGTGSSTTPPQ